MNRQLRGTDLKRLHRRWKRTAPPSLGLILEAVSSPFNVGAIVRTAAAFGADHLYLVGDTASPRSPKTQKTALGTDRYLVWSAHDDVVSAVRAAHGDGYRVVALELATEAVPLHTVDLTGQIALLVGHEDRGVSPEALAAADATGYLPQLGRVGSLNVATACSIALYEARRQQLAGHEPAEDGAGTGAAADAAGD